MHRTQFGYEQQCQLLGPDGTVVWYGTIIFGQATTVASTEASADILAGGAVIIDGPNTTFGRDANLGTSDPDILLISGKRVASAASLGHLGVAAELIPAAKSGLIAGMGSMLSVRTTAVAVAVGDLVGGSATAGLTATIARTTAGTILGVCLKLGAQIGTSGLWTCGLLVAPE